MSDYYDPDGRAFPIEQWGKVRGEVWEREHLETKVEGGTVSTVWMGLDHSWGEGPPLIFESMIFGEGPLDQTQERYATREQAHAGHDVMVDRLNVERAAWRDLVADERLRDCARVIAEVLTEHSKAHAGSDYGLGDRFAEFVQAMEADS